MRIRSAWLSHGFWNSLEHAVTRIADAATMMVLLWVLPTETFGRLALAQAWIAPILLLFIAPETVIYRDYARWKAESLPVFSARIRALRLFGWGKALFALALAAWVPMVFQGQIDWYDGFCVFAWALFLSISPQISGADREFLRLDLRLRELSAITVFQKVTLLGCTVGASVLFPGRVDALAVGVTISALSTALLAWQRVSSVLGAPSREPGLMRGTLFGSFGTFSIWNHVSGVASNWIQTMDLFFLGVFRAPAELVGLYAAGAKLANLSKAAPIALGNLFSIWLGRRVEDKARESAEVRHSTLLLVCASLGQAAVILALAPSILSLLSRGRWSPQETAQIVSWLKWILAGGVLFSSALFVHSWLLLRRPVQDLLLRVYLPWILFALAGYGGAMCFYGIEAVAMMNFPVMGFYLVLLLIRVRSWSV